MIRNFKTLGVALMAVFAMSAVVASAASATNDVFESEKVPVTLTGTQVAVNKFTLAGQAVECTGISVDATVTASPVSQITTGEPVYSGCTYAGGAATVHMNGCKYLLTGTTDVSGDAQVAIVDCPKEKHIAITSTAINCTITVKAKGAIDGNQVAEEGVHYTNDGAGTTAGVLIDLTAKVKVTSEGGTNTKAGEPEGVTCASLTNNTGTLDGTITVTGEETVAPFAHIGISVK
jgi:hypothetical protein